MAGILGPRRGDGDPPPDFGRPCALAGAIGFRSEIWCGYPAHHRHAAAAHDSILDNGDLPISRRGGISLAAGIRVGPGIFAAGRVELAARRGMGRVRRSDVVGHQLCGRAGRSILRGSPEAR